MEHWELLDVLKALLAVVAGIILGLEREMKDKAAGLKTITIICLGATLFSIISYKVGGNGNSTAIAAYIVSGVGFIGAGAIFKDGFSISGLTTAGIIWLAAAVGTAIGFGEFYLAATFIAGSLLIMILTPLFNRFFRSKQLTRPFTVQFNKTQPSLREELLQELTSRSVLYGGIKLIQKEDKLEMQMELVLDHEKLKWLQEFLLQHSSISSFSL